MIEPKNIADYYNQTLNHYQQHWKLNTSKALHYGLWYPSTKNLSEALENTNKKIAKLADIKQGYRILDAGCGIGGTAMYLASNHDCQIDGITLSQKQIELGNEHINKLQLNKKVSLHIMNYVQTDFPDNTFDIIYGVESICQTRHKEDFIKEASRILKPNGKLIVIDFFQKKKILNDKETDIMNNWLHRWAVEHLEIADQFIEKSEKLGFQTNSNEALTPLIYPSAKRLYRSSLLGSIPSELYRLFNRNVSQYAKSHYKSGIYQYKALQEELWDYRALSFVKS